MVSLPLLVEPRRAPAPGDLVRLYHRLQLHWSRHFADEMVLDAGAAFVNPELDDMPAANRLLDAAVPEGSSAEQTIERVVDFYAVRGAVCRHWVPNPAVPVVRIDSLRTCLAARGLESVSEEIWYLSNAPADLPAGRADLQVLPARAAFRYARSLAEEAASAGGAEAAMLHLDDPHYECLLALEHGKPLGRAGLLTDGELGLIEQVFVSPSARRQQVAATLVAHLLALAGRALLRHVLLSVPADNTAAHSLFRPLGFQRIGTFDYYVDRTRA